MFKIFQLNQSPQTVPIALGRNRRSRRKSQRSVHIRHSSLTDGSATWPNSVDLIQAVPGGSTEAIVPLIDGEILVKFVDELGNESDG